MMAAETLRLAYLQMRRSPGAVVCAVLTLAAIMTPLLIIFGLKFGLVSAMRKELLQTPSTMEIRLNCGHRFTQKDIEALRSLPGVGFLIAEHGSVYSNVGIQPEGAKPSAVTYPLVPTAAGDPDLVLTGQAVPQEAEMVLTTALARALKLEPGSQAVMTVWRNGYRESMQESFKIIGVLKESCNAGKCAYVAAPVAERVRQFIEQGAGVAEAEENIPAAHYSAVVLPGESEHAAAVLKEYFADLREESAGERTHGAIPAGTRILQAPRGIAADIADSMLSMAKAADIQAYAWVPPMAATIAETGTDVVVESLHTAEGKSFVCPPPYVFAAPGEGLPKKITLKLAAAEGKVSTVVCRVAEQEGVPAGHLLAPPQVALLCRYATEEPLNWDCTTGGLKRQNTDYYVGARIYADALEHTEPLVARLKEAGVSCRADVNTIRQFLHLEYALNMLFYILCSSGAAGAVISLGMSLFNAAELQRRNYAMVRLLGASRCDLALIPMSVALLQTLLAVVLSTAAFYAAALFIGVLFSGSATEMVLCRIEPCHLWQFLLLSLVTAWFASLAAAFKVMFISPSEIIRES